MSKPKWGCSGSSESSLVIMPHCWKSHAAAHLCFIMFNLLAGVVGWSVVCNCVVPGHTHLLLPWCVCVGMWNFSLYYIPITDTTLELSVFWSSGTESRIKELRFSESISLSFKTRLTSVTCFCGDVM